MPFERTGEVAGALGRAVATVGDEGAVGVVDPLDGATAL